LVARQHKDVFLEDMYKYIFMGYWTVLPYRAACHFPALHLDPAGVVPQPDHRLRSIIDYSFYGLNEDTCPLAPHHAMQFGSTLQYMLQHLVYFDCHYGPPFMAKLDLADGYHRVPISATAALHLAIVIPMNHPTEKLIALPLSLPMGWSQSPPYFCAFTETFTNIANQDKSLDISHPLLSQSQQGGTIDATTTTFLPSAVTLPCTAPSHSAITTSS
jgi:hypothetical protein